MFLTTAKPKEGIVLVLETNLVEKSNNIWIINSGATNNVCTFLQGLQVQRQLSDREFTLRVGTGDSVSDRKSTRLNSSHT